MICTPDNMITNFSCDNNCCWKGHWFITSWRNITNMWHWTNIPTPQGHWWSTISEYCMA
jgi:hypothetical protein